MSSNSEVKEWLPNLTVQKVLDGCNGKMTNLRDYMLGQYAGSYGIHASVDGVIVVAGITQPMLCLDVTKQPSDHPLEGMIKTSDFIGFVLPM